MTKPKYWTKNEENVSDETMYKYLVSHKRDRKSMTISRIYQKGDLLLSCDKDFVDLTETPDAVETETWNCVFRMGGHRLNTRLRFNDMAMAFRSIHAYGGARLKIGPDLINRIDELSNEGMTPGQIAQVVGVTNSMVITCLKTLMKKNTK